MRDASGAPKFVNSILMTISTESLGDSMLGHMGNLDNIYGELSRPQSSLLS